MDEPLGNRVVDRNRSHISATVHAALRVHAGAPPDGVAPTFRPSNSQDGPPV